MDNTANNNSTLLVNKLKNNITNIKDQDLLTKTIDNFTQDCLKQNKKISDIQNIILDLIKTKPKNTVQIIKGFTQGCILQKINMSDIQDITLKLIKENQIDAYLILSGFFQGCHYSILSNEDKINIRNRFFKEINLKPIDLEVIKQNPIDVTNEIYIFIQNCLTKNKNILDIKDIVLKTINLESIKKDLIHIYFIIKVFVKSCLEQNKKISDIQNVIFDLIKKSPENNIYYIIHGLIIGYLEQGKNIKDLKSFFIEASKNESIGIDIIHGFIQSCISNEKYKLNSEDIDFIIEIITNNNNKSIKESEKILCGMYTSVYILKLFKKQNDKNIELPKVSSKFIDLLNKILRDNKSKQITKIEDLTIKEIKQLFNNLMDIKFNKTKNNINGYNIKKGPFLQIITSLAENSGVNENTTINELFFNRDNQENSKIEEYQNKLNNFDHIEISKNTQINSINDFLNVFNLKKEDFKKKGFKTFHVEFPLHEVTIVVNTSKSYDKFINNNKNVINDVIMIDSSHGIKYMINDGKLKFSNQQTQDFIKKIPVPNRIYQENGTCWANACCANAVLLNNCKNFDDIVDRKKDKIILKEEIQDEIIIEASEYYLSNVKKIEKESDYQKIDDNIFKVTKIDFKKINCFKNLIKYCVHKKDK